MQSKMQNTRTRHNAKRQIPLDNLNMPRTDAGSQRKDKGCNAKMLKRNADTCENWGKLKTCFLDHYRVFLKNENLVH